MRIKDNKIVNWKELKHLQTTSLIPKYLAENKKTNL